jgi:hypothetical protein
MRGRDRGEDILPDYVVQTGYEPANHSPNGQARRALQRPKFRCLGNLAHAKWGSHSTRLPPIDATPGFIHINNRRIYNSTSPYDMAPSLIEPESMTTVYSPLKYQETTTPDQSPPHEEHQYLNLIREILKNGEHRPDRY